MKPFLNTPALALLLLVMLSVPSCGPTDQLKNAQSVPSDGPTDQLKNAQEAFGRLGASYESKVDPQTKITHHVFQMAQSTKDEDLKKLPDVPFGFTLNLHMTKVTDAGLKEMKNLDNLNSLNLEYTKVTDAGLKELKELKNLNSLNLKGTRVTDAGLKELKELKNLNSLNLHMTRVTIAGLKDIKELKNRMRSSIAFRLRVAGLKWPLTKLYLG